MWHVYTSIKFDSLPLSILFALSIESHADGEQQCRRRDSMVSFALQQRRPHRHVRMVPASTPGRFGLHLFNRCVRALCTRFVIYLFIISRVLINYRLLQIKRSIDYERCNLILWFRLSGKRFCEPRFTRRSWLVWFYDTSKQGMGAFIIHMANVWLASQFTGDPCTW